jgi:flagellar hook-associated protein 3 FlgL
MRVTHNSQYVGFTRNLNEIQTRRNREQIKLQTGKDIINLSDSPEKVVDVKLVDKKIDQNEKYIDNLDLLISELYATDETITNIGDLVDDIRIKAIDATKDEPATLQVVGNNFKNLLTDLVRLGNQEYDGRFMFAGTKTTSQSITPENPDNPRVPFEIVEDEPTADNPSGLRVVFHGNNEDRIINKDEQTTQVINQKQEEIFGANNELFNTLIELHNTISYTPDGSPRGDRDFLTRTEVEQIDQLQKQLSEFSEEINKIGARNGTTLERSQNLYNQMIDENIRLKDYRSIREDADVAEATLNLQKEEFALQYALQVGARINQTSLFDFLR